MTRRFVHRWIALGLLGLTGCANFAAPPETPARNIDFSGQRQSPPGEHFYVIIFGSESTPRVPRLTHSWATFIHEIDCPCGPGLLDVRTISWMPATLIIHPWHFKIECGKNLELHETLHYALGEGEHVAQWGPYECRPELFYRAAVQKQFLENGGMGYECVDTAGEAGRTGRGSDCIHAITDMDPQYTRARYRLIRFGIAASRFITGELGRRDMLLHIDKRHDELNRLLGLDAYPIHHREYPRFPRLPQAAL